VRILDLAIVNDELLSNMVDLGFQTRKRN